MGLWRGIAVAIIAEEIALILALEIIKILH